LFAVSNGFLACLLNPVLTWTQLFLLPYLYKCALKVERGL